DVEPQGWRRCALAFLEAQTWRESLGGVANEARPEATLELEPRNQPPRRRGARSVLCHAAWAAGVLVSFAIGWATSGVWKSMSGWAVGALAGPAQNPAPRTSAGLAESVTEAPPAHPAADSHRATDMRQPASTSSPSVHTVALLAWGPNSENGTYAHQVP